MRFRPRSISQSFSEKHFVVIFSCMLSRFNVLSQVHVQLHKLPIWTSIFSSSTCVSKWVESNHFGGPRYWLWLCDHNPMRNTLRKDHPNQDQLTYCHLGRKSEPRSLNVSVISFVPLVGDPVLSRRYTFEIRVTKYILQAVTVRARLLKTLAGTHPWSKD